MSMVGPTIGLDEWPWYPMRRAINVTWRRDARCSDHGNVPAYIRIRSTQDADGSVTVHRVEGRCRTEPCCWTDITEEKEVADRLVTSGGSAVADDKLVVAECPLSTCAWTSTTYTSEDDALDSQKMHLRNHTHEELAEAVWSHIGRLAAHVRVYDRRMA